MLIYSVYLPYNLCLSTADKDFSNLTCLQCSYLGSVSGRMHKFLTCWAALLDCRDFICWLQSHWRWIPAHFQSRNLLQFFQVGWAFSMKTKILHNHALTLRCLFSYWQMYWPTLCHCPIFLNIWVKDKCYLWSKDLPSFLPQVAFVINWYQEQGLFLNVEKRNTLQWLWQPCCLI